MKRSLNAFVLSAVLTCVALPAFAQGPAALPEPGNAAIIRSTPRPCILQALRIISPQMVNMLSKKLNLDDAQKTKVTDLLNKAEEGMKPKIDAQRKASEEFVALLTNDSADQATLTAASDKAMKAEQALVEDRIQALIALKALLNDQQKKSLDEFIEQRTFPWRGQPETLAPVPVPASAPAPKTQ